MTYFTMPNRRLLLANVGALDIQNTNRNKSVHLYIVIHSEIFKINILLKLVLTKIGWGRGITQETDNSKENLGSYKNIS